MKNVRTRQQIVLDEIKKWHQGRIGRFDVVVDRLQLTLPTWSRERIGSVLLQALSNPDRHLHVGTAQSIVFSGSDAAIYDLLRDGIRRTWAAHVGLREAEPQNVSRYRFAASKAAGAWQHPDVLMHAYPRRRDSGETSKRTHAVEVEWEGGFGVPSVYQALEQGRGADYSWVFGLAAPSFKSAHLERITRAATEHGIGVVLMPNVSRPFEWRTVLMPARRRPTDVERLDLMSRCGFSATAA